MPLYIAPTRLDEACTRLAELPGVEIHARSAAGKVVVTLEDNDTQTAADSYAALHGVPGVLAVAMVYQYCDDQSEPEEVKV